MRPATATVYSHVNVGRLVERACLSKVNRRLTFEAPTNRGWRQNEQQPLSPPQPPTTPISIPPFHPSAALLPAPCAASLRFQVLVAQLLQDGHHECGQVWHPAAPQPTAPQSRQAGRRLNSLTACVCLPRSSAGSNRTPPHPLRCFLPRPPTTAHSRVCDDAKAGLPCDAPLHLAQRRTHARVRGTPHSAAVR